MTDLTEKTSANGPLIVEGKHADNERLKLESNYLRGTIEADLKDKVTGGFTADNFQLIRTHGMYQQDDRDIRNERTKQKLEPLHNVTSAYAGWHYHAKTVVSH